MADRKRKREDAYAYASPAATSLAPPRRHLPPHQLVLAPMVGGSELAFRLLARRHGATLCYSPMIRSEEFTAKRTERGIGQLEVHPHDAPLVAHFSGNDASVLLAAAKRAEQLPGVAAVDLNLGCPQRSAHSGHFGAFLCIEPSDRQRVLTMVATLAHELTVPVFAKIRLLDDGVDETIRFAQQLEAAGCALLAVHGRYRGSPMHRRDGAAHLDQVRAIKQRLSIPVLTNGNVRNAAELMETLASTGCDGVMSAEGALDDPAIFARACAASKEERGRLKSEVKATAQLRQEARAKGRELSDEEKRVVAQSKESKVKLKALPKLRRLDLTTTTTTEAGEGAGGEGGSGEGASGGGGSAGGGSGGGGSASADASACYASAPLDLAEQYLDLVGSHPPPGECGDIKQEIVMAHTIFHLRRLCRTLLTDFNLLAELKACTSLAACAGVIKRCRAYAEGTMDFKGRRRPASYWKRQQRRGKVIAE